jgi:hypothetical protein
MTEDAQTAIPANLLPVVPLLAGTECHRTGVMYCANGWC